VARAKTTVDLVVRNSGAIIPEREQTRIFERFYRGAHARLVSGTGMGLAIVQQIVQAHGGRILLTGGGDHRAFHISLPKFVS